MMDSLVIATSMPSIVEQNDVAAIADPTNGDCHLDALGVEYTRVTRACFVDAPSDCRLDALGR